MQGFLEAVGAESAERRLSAFLAEVRVAVPAEEEQQTHRSVLNAAVTTLDRRLHSALQVLESQRAEATAETRLIERHLSDLERTIDTVHGRPDAAQLEEAAERLAVLEELVPALAGRTAQAKRARQWINDLGDAAAEWRGRDRDTEFGVTSPGLLRALTEVSAALDSMTTGVQQRRDARQASVTDMGFARLAQLGGIVQGTDEKHKKLGSDEAQRRLMRLTGRLAKLGVVRLQPGPGMKAGSEKHGGT